MSNNELVGTLKPGGSATEWLVVHADDPNIFRAFLKEIDNGLATEFAQTAERFRQVTAAGGNVPQVQGVQVVNGTAQEAWPPASAVQQPPAVVAPVAQAAPQAQPVASPQPQAWSASPQPAAAAKWNPPTQLPAGFNGQVGPNGGPIGSDGYEMKWMVGQPSAQKKGYGAWFSGNPDRNAPNKAEPIWIHSHPKLG